MPLTPAEIEQTTFSTALRGYDLNEVDDFLDRVVASMKELEEDLAEARSRHAEAGQGEATPSQDASVVGRALVAAQQAADKMIEDASAEAVEILEQARTAADSIESARDARRAEAEAEMELLGQRVAEVRTQLAVLATDVADRLDEMDAAVNGALGNEDEAGPTEVTGSDVTEEEWDESDSDQAAQPNAHDDADDEEVDEPDEEVDEPDEEVDEPDEEVDEDD